MSIPPVVPGEKPPNAASPSRRPAVPSSCRHWLPSWQTMSVQAVAKLPHSATSPLAHCLQSWSLIASLIAPEKVLVSVPMKEPRPRLAA